MTERTPQIKIRVNTYSLNTNFGQCKINQLHTENSVSRASLNSSSAKARGLTQCAMLKKKR